jgi:alpha-D-ribose 1-methylphosphonate 5-triphosphate synthase subunit PhnG
MNRRKRTEILVMGSRDLSRRLAGEIMQKYKVKRIEDPNNGLVMIKMRETARKELFYLGEVLVTECKVYVNGALGLGIVAGDEEELALNMALIDGAYRSAVPETGRWDELLLNEEKFIREREQKETRKILETKVDFSTMNV